MSKENDFSWLDGKDAEKSKDAVPHPITKAYCPVCKESSHFLIELTNKMYRQGAPKHLVSPEMCQTCMYIYAIKLRFSLEQREAVIQAHREAILSRGALLEMPRAWREK